MLHNRGTDASNPFTVNGVVIIRAEFLRLIDTTVEVLYCTVDLTRGRGPALQRMWVPPTAVPATDYLRQL